MIDLMFNELRDRNTKSVLISATHGDFQKGNMRISNNEINVLDWESVDDRFYLYDLFVFYGGVREGNDIQKSILIFFETVPESFLKVNNLNKILLSLEELRFHINESISNNYFKTRDKLFSVLKEVENFSKNLNKNKN